MNTTNNADAGKNLLWPGATPYFDASIAPKSLRASGGRSRPQGVRLCGRTPGYPASAIRANSCPTRPTLLTCATQVQPKENPCLY